jgi:hypothetical protein
VSGIPALLEIFATELMDFVVVEERLGNAKAGDITLAACWYIPVTRDC